MAEGFRDSISVWEEWRVEADEYRELDGERVLVLDHYSGRGKTSGLEVGQMGARERPCSTSAAARSQGLVIYLDRERARSPTSASLQRLAPRARSSLPRPSLVATSMLAC
jgi:hypothetical protein